MLPVQLTHIFCHSQDLGLQIYDWLNLGNLIPFTLACHTCLEPHQLELQRLQGVWANQGVDVTHYISLYYQVNWTRLGPATEPAGDIDAAHQDGEEQRQHCAKAAELLAEGTVSVCVCVCD